MTDQLYPNVRNTVSNAYFYRYRGAFFGFEFIFIKWNVSEYNDFDFILAVLISLLLIRNSPRSFADEV